MSAAETSSDQQLQAEVERLRARVAALEAELVEVQARANAAVAAAQERAYWLDRWHLDLNAADAHAAAPRSCAAPCAPRRAVTRASDGPSAGCARERRHRRAQRSVVIPVKDGERYLEELLDALAREGVDEVLVIDSGSTRPLARDRSRQPACEVLEIEPSEFGHGRTRNLGARAHRRRADLLPHAGRDPVPGLARRLPRGVHARRARRRRLRAAPAARRTPAR